MRLIYDGARFRQIKMQPWTMSVSQRDAAFRAVSGPEAQNTLTIPKSYREWQEWQDSNLQHPVLETGTLPVELHS